MRLLRAVVCLAAVLALLAGCSAGAGPTTASTLPPADDGGPGVIFVALGGAETSGSGLDDGLRQAWPQVLFRDALPRRAIYVNLASPGATVARALDAQVPAALELDPTLATVWLTAGDAGAGTRVAAYERDLELVVRRLQEAGARVLVATGPAPAGPAAPVESYSVAVRQVSQRTGADFVDLSELDLSLGASAHRQAAEAFARVLASEPP